MAELIIDVTLLNAEESASTGSGRQSGNGQPQQSGGNGKKK